MPLNTHIVKSRMLEILSLSNPYEEYQIRLLNTSNLDKLIALYPPRNSQEILTYLCALFFHGKDNEDRVINILLLMGPITYPASAQLDRLMLRLAIEHKMKRVVNYFFTVRPYLNTELFSKEDFDEIPFLPAPAPSKEISLKQEKDKIDDILSKENFQILQEAAMHGDLVIFNTLIRELSSNSVDALKSNPEKLQVIFYHAAHNGHIAIVGRIFELFRKNRTQMVQFDNFKIFYTAAAQGNLELLRVLTTTIAKNDVIRMVEAQGVSALEAARINRNLDVILFLISFPKLALYARNNEEYTPLLAPLPTQPQKKSRPTYFFQSNERLDTDGALTTTKPNRFF